MKKKILIACLLFLCVSFGIIAVLWNHYGKQETPIYAFINTVEVENNEIKIQIFGEGNYKYKRYEIIDEGNGIYKFQLYGNFLSGELFPMDITIPNAKDIKEIHQKNFDGEQELVYPHKDY